jgi:F-type H+-transporting ATPase subunit epsilon
MADHLKVELVTPERRVLACEASTVALPGAEGELGVLPGHLPLLTTLRPGTLTVTHLDARVETFAVSTGFAEVMPDRVTVLTDSAEAAAAIDITQAKAALADAEQALASPQAASIEASASAEEIASAQRQQAEAEAARMTAFEFARARVETYEASQRLAR